MLREDNTQPAARRGAATVARLSMAVCLAVAILLPADRTHAEPLDAATTKQAYALVETWMSALTVPAESLPIAVDDVIGAAVTLRFEGAPIGEAYTTIADPLKPIRSDEPVDISPLLRQATAAAIDHARKSVQIIAGRSDGSAAGATLESLAPLLVVEVQLARAPQRVRLTSLQELPRLYKPGLHGLALRHGDKWAWVYPGTAVASNVSLSGQLQRMLKDLNLPAAAMPMIGQGDGPKLYRFSAMHAVRARGGEPIRTLHRGSAPLPATGLTSEQIAAACSRWAKHLRERQNARGDFTGTYEPTANRYSPKTASHESAALACLALARYAKLADVPAEERRQCHEAARYGVETLLGEFGVKEDGTDVLQTSPVRTAAAATTLLALMELQDAANLKPQRERLAGMLLTAVQPDGAVRTHDNPRAGVSTKPAHALITYALARMFRLSRNPIYLKQAQLAATALWRDTTPEQAAEAMPWAALLEFELMRTGSATTGLIIARRATDVLWSKQVPVASADASDNVNSPDYVSPDTVGGFALDNALLPEPTWHSAGPTVALAAAMTIENFINDNERIDWLVNTTLALRFLDQLTMRPDDAYYAAKVGRAVDGVRAAPWDNRLPLGATAMSLYAAAEFRHSLNALGRE